MNFRKAYDIPVDDAHSRICSAEMCLDHAYTDADKRNALDMLAKAQRYLQRACDARRAWLAAEHDEYEVYTDVPYETQGDLL